jgi:hypothetical protein
MSLAHVTQQLVRAQAPDVQLTMNRPAHYNSYSSPGKRTNTITNTAQTTHIELRNDDYSATYILLLKPREPTLETGADSGTK